MIVFILGRTGSGKSTTARYLGEVAQRSGWFVHSFNDYFFLREMFEHDAEQKFRATEHDGFEVIEPSVFQIAIRLLAQQVRSYYPIDNQTLITVEFTSNNYRESLRCFDSRLLEEAYFLFLNVDLSLCLERTCKRVFNRTSQDDYYVKDTVLLKHYSCPYMPLCVNGRKVQFLENMGSIDDLRHTLQALVSPLLDQQVRNKIPSLQENRSAIPV